MGAFIEKHLAGITPESLDEFRKDAFIPFASSTGTLGNAEIGVSGRGLFTVRRRINGKSVVVMNCKSPEYAISCYAELLKS